jgi:hypothetical protein
MQLLLFIPEIIALLTAMNAQPTEMVREGNYTRYSLQDSCAVEVLEYATGDSVLVVQTVCAPVCSSTARVYNKETYTLLRVIPPTIKGVFPYAWIENGQLHWRDNTGEILDDEEKRL